MAFQFAVNEGRAHWHQHEAGLAEGQLSLLTDD